MSNNKNMRTASFGIAAFLMLLGRYPVSWILSSRSSKKLVPEHKIEFQECRIKSHTGNVLFVSTKGTREKPAMVLIHGINANSRQWEHQQAFFGKYYYLVLIDLPGHGKSDYPIDMSIEALAMDLSTVLTKLNIERPVLYGHSLGGMMIQEYCLKKLSPPPRAIILQNCSYTNPLKTMPIGPIPPLFQKQIITPALKSISRHNKLFTSLGYIAYTSGMGSLFYRFLLFSGKQSAKTLRAMASFAAATTANACARSLLSTFAFDATHSLEKINVPCLVLVASGDRIIDPSAGEYLHRQISGSEFAILKGGHQNLVEYPEDTNLSIHQFLGRNNI